jgi:hypothetical protein
MIGVRGFAAGAALALALAACGQREADAPAAAQSGPREDARLELGEWNGFPNAESARISGSTLTLPAQGGAMIPVRNDNAAAGDAVVAHMTLRAASEGSVRAALVRHCNADRGEEADSREVALTTAPTPVRLERTFAQAYDCYRVQITSTGAPVTVTVSDLSVTKIQ